MPRGNDAQAAAAEFRGQYGMMGNAEDLIQANRAANPADLRAASLGSINEKATDKLDLDKVAKAADVSSGRVLSAAVRGDKVVAVVETEGGAVYKEVVDATDAGLKNEDLRAAAFVGPQAAGGADSDEQAVLLANNHARNLIAEATKEAERIVAEAVEKAQAEASKAAQKAHDEAAKVAADSAKEQEKAAKADADKS